MKRGLLGWVLALMGWLTVSTGVQAAPRDWQAIISSGTLRVAVAEYAPWVLRSAEGELRGFEVDVARRLAREMGLQVDFVVSDWAQLIPTLLKGDADLIASGFSIAPERALQVAFSRPYANSGIGLLTNTGKTASFAALADMNAPDVGIAVVAKSQSESVAKQLFSQAQLQSFANHDSAVQALLKGQVHALVAPLPMPRFLALQYPGKVDEPLNEPLRSTRDAFAVHYDNQRLLTFLNAWIEAHQADGWLDNAHRYWFDTLEWRGGMKE